MSQSVYRGLDQQALDREYSPSAFVPGGIEPYIARYAALSQSALSQSTPASPGVFPGLAYGSHPDEIMDLFVPAGDGPWPLHVLIHGGFWQALSQRDFAFPGPAFQRQGVAFASLNYSLAPAATIGEIVDQCARALVWLHANASRWAFDPQNISISGHSAGAHICAMLLTRDWVLSGLREARIASALLISGVYDLEPIRLSYVNHPLNLSEAQVAAWSPINLEVLVDCPIHVVWGEHDSSEFKRQSQDYSARITRNGRSIATVEIPARNHFDILFDLLKPPSQRCGTAGSAEL